VITQLKDNSAAAAREPILLVEDSVEDFEATVRAFKKAGLANPLAHVTSGERALEHLRTSARPCLILLDLNMPGMGGIKFLEVIKQDAAFREIPVVILTTSNYEPDIKACYALGANAYVLKSADFEVLAMAIKRLKEYWLDTVVLPVIFDEEAANGKTGFTIANGEGPDVHLSPADVKNKIIGQKPYKPLDEKSKLTPHEIETLTWIARGKSRWETGVILGVSEDTVKARLEKCRQKLDASNTTHAIAIALLHDLLNY
jgi:two-component system response regulator